MNKETIIALQAMAILLLAGVFGVLMSVEYRLNRQIQRDNEALWKDSMDKTVKLILAEGKIEDLQRKIDEDSTQAFNPKALTPSEARRKK